MTGDAQRPEILQTIRIHWPLETTIRAEVIDLAGGFCHRLLADAASVTVSCEHERTQIHHARPRLEPSPEGRVTELFPLHRLLVRVRVGFEEAADIPQRGEAVVQQQ